MADPRVIQFVRKAAAATGADPNALLADSLVESGARTGAVGDQGTSFGPWQFHRGGALGTHSPAWANSYAAALNRAQEFARLQVHGGKGAAAIQRPADPTGYAAKVQAALPQARSLLGSTPTQVPQEQRVIPGRDLFRTLFGNEVADSANPLQPFLDRGAQIAGIPTIQLPQAAAPALPAVAGPKGAGATVTTQPNGRVVQIAKPKLIGFPNQGTHTLGNWESDNAVDVAMPTGTPVYAAADGIIGPQIGALTSSQSSRFAGLRVHLKTASDELYYAHLSRLAVKAGQRVRAGQLIGYSGSANGVQHLHLGSKNGNPRTYA